MELRAKLMTRFKMTSQTRRRIISVLISLLFFFVLMDALLFWIDPLGLVDAVHSNHDFNRIMIDHPTGYALPPGTHRFHYWSATILDDYTRYIPATNTAADCTIATIGDSMTFGAGVENDATWVNILAEQFQGVHFINSARPDYSAANVAGLKSMYPADGYIWLIVQGDEQIAYHYTGAQPAYAYPPATALYRVWLWNQLQGRQTFFGRGNDMEGYWQAVNTIASENVLLFGFNGEPLAHATAERYPVIFVPPRSHPISAVDKHPRPAGHQGIADAMYPYMIEFIEMVCDDVP